jgi:hypothetical protein
MELIALWSIDQFIKDIERDADFCLLGGSDPFFMSAEELDKMMTNTKMNFTLTHTPPRQLYFLSGVKILLDDKL